MAGVAENASEGVQLISVSSSPQQEEEGEPQETKAAPTANGGGGADDAAAVEKARRRKLKEHMKPDENAMTVGILNIMFTAFTVGRWPQSFFLLHLVKTTVLLPWRYIRFRKRKWQWYLIEFCYFVSYATLICCFLALLRTSTGYESPLTEYNDIFFRVGFSFATGPLVWSVVIFKNSIVLHDIDQLTSTFIHLSPPLLFWCWRWGGGMGPSIVGKTWPGMLSICGNPLELEAQPNATALASLAETFEGVDACATWTTLWCNDCTATAWELIVVPQAVYVLLWALPYYLLMFGLCAGSIEKNGCDTLYKHTLATNASVKKFVDLAPCDALRPLFYIFVHQASAFIFGMIFLAAYNGATYTFRVFLGRYEKDLMKKHPSLANMQVETKEKEEEEEKKKKDTRTETAKDH